MAKSKLPPRVWFWAAYMMSTHSNGVSAKQNQHQFDVDYHTAWPLKAKLRRAMVRPSVRGCRALSKSTKLKCPSVKVIRR